MLKINYLGHSSFKISGKSSTGEDITVITDPFDKKDVGLPYSTQTADIVTLSHTHDDHNKIENIKGNPEDDYFLIDTPGEYEINGLRIFGIKSFHDAKKGDERGHNTIFTFDFEEARIAHLGDLGHKLESSQSEIIGDIDILIIPVGGIFTIDPKTAMNVIEDIEPLCVIPMHYKTSKHDKMYDKLSTLDDFLKEAGIKSEPQKELKIKSHNDLPQQLTIIPLEL